MDKSKKNTYIIAGVSLVLILAAVYFLFIFKKGPRELKKQEASGDVKELAQIDLAKRPYVTLTPTPEGAEIIISVENMASFDKIEYELTYQADNPTVAGEKIQRGATGTDINTKDQKYKKSILLGTASRGVRSPDRGIVDGKLTMHMFQGDTEYQSETNWTLDEIGTFQTTLKDPSGNFEIAIPALGKNYWAILGDTIGVPPNYKFDIKNVALPVYGVFSVAPALTKPANVTIKLKDAVKSADLYAYSHQDSTYAKLDSELAGSTVTSDVPSLATFVVVASK